MEPGSISARASSTAPEGTTLATAVDAFLAGRTAAPGFCHALVGQYRALCRHEDGVSPAPPCLLAGDDGAVYVPAGQEASLRDVLVARRFRSAGSTLAIRLPEALGGHAGVFDLWASPRYLAARAGTPGGGTGEVWK